MIYEQYLSFSLLSFLKGSRNLLFCLRVELKSQTRNVFKLKL